MLSDGGPRGLALEPLWAGRARGVPFLLETPRSDSIASDIITEAIVGDRENVRECVLMLRYTELSPFRSQKIGGRLNARFASSDAKFLHHSALMATVIEWFSSRAKGGIDHVILPGKINCKLLWRLGGGCSLLIYRLWIGIKLVTANLSFQLHYETELYLVQTTSLMDSPPQSKVLRKHFSSQLYQSFDHVYLHKTPQISLDDL